MVADGLAELQVRWPTVPIVHCETRKLAEEWTFRYLAAAHVWACQESAARARAGTLEEPATASGPAAPALSDTELREWARQSCMAVSDRGRVSRGIFVRRGSDRAAWGRGRAREPRR